MMFGQVGQSRFRSHGWGSRVLSLLSVVGTTLTSALVFALPAFAGPLDVPASEVSAEGKLIVKEMMANPRGPYSRIRWYCNDGSEQPPKANACTAHGGGRQHAEYSSARSRLAELGWSVGTIFAPLTYTALKDLLPREQRLRELPLERYLIDTDDGWVLRNAQGYRGRVQLEDEVAAGQKILLAAVTDQELVNNHYLLLRELVRVIPHGEETDLSRRVRRAAIELAELEPSAEKWRAEVHTTPSVQTSDKIRRWAEAQNKVGVKSIALELAADLDRLYGASGRRARLEAQLKKLNGSAMSEWRNKVLTALAMTPMERVVGLCEASTELRRQGFTSSPSAQRLAALDALGSIESEVQLAAKEIAVAPSLSREELRRQTIALLGCVYGAGLISEGELASVTDALTYANAIQVPIAAYASGIAQLKRVPNWAAGIVRYTFAEALTRYTALEPKATRFTDDLLRGSPLASLGDLITILSHDLANITGSEVRVNGKPAPGAIALNPGMGRGVLRIYETLEEAEAASPAPTDIVALPETIAELKPIAGILTLGEGNALSHVQLLARNFGIPNVAIDYSVVDLIKPLAGQEVVLIVGSDGNVVLQAAAEIPNVDQLFPVSPKQDVSERITVPPADLNVSKELTLPNIGRHLSGKVIGPKAANLGELNRLFPGRVAPAIAIPFGIYAQHLNSKGLKERINTLYAAHAKGTVSNDELNQELANIREGISQLTLSSELQESLRQTMLEQFGEPDTYGVFVRSDTNVEDLPQFTGAGLSETVANVTGLENQFAAVPRVWASVLSPRAIAWRSSLLTNPQEIYASVLLMKSVPSQKSGVLVTANLAKPDESGLTISTAWGVGGAVSGEAAESIVVKPDGKTLLISEAKTPYQRALNPAGGVSWKSAPAGRILNQSDIDQLQALAAEVKQKYVPVNDETGKQRPWDIEFGFVDGELTLFQIRPLVEKSTRRADTVIKSFISNKSRSTMQVDLSVPVDLQTSSS